MHQSSYDKMENFVSKYLTVYNSQILRILDIGSQDINGCYKPLFDNVIWDYKGADVAVGKNVDIVLGNIYDWKEIKSASLDVVISGQAFEHIEYTWITMYEIARVLKEGGLCCIVAPSGGVEHKYPFDCWRFYPDGFKALAKYVCLEALEVYTQWGAGGYLDGSDEWRDSVLICRKPYMSKKEKIFFYLKNFLSKLILKI